MQNIESTSSFAANKKKEQIAVARVREISNRSKLCALSYAYTKPYVTHEVRLGYLAADSLPMLYDNTNKSILLSAGFFPKRWR